MADFTQIIQEINADINTNGVGAITGAKLNEVLRDIIAAVNAAKQDPLTIDATPTEGSTNPVQSGGVYEALEGKADKRTFEVLHIHQIPIDIASGLLVGDFVVDTSDGRRLYVVTYRNANDFLLVTSDGVSLVWYSYENNQYSDNGFFDSSVVSQEILEIINSLDGKQDTISDLATIRSGAAAGATAYQKPSGGIPKIDLASGVQTSLGKADTAFQKPSGGIPESDLSSDVQQALQKHFKGWYVSSNVLPANPVVGDYAYVKGATSTDPAAIYECTTAGTWSDSGRTADTSNVQTFASGEEVNETYIDNDFVGGNDKVAGADEVKTLREETPRIITDENTESFNIIDENGNIFARINENGLKTKNFDSAEINPSQFLTKTEYNEKNVVESPIIGTEDSEEVVIIDENYNILARIDKDGIKTKNFDSKETSNKKTGKITLQNSDIITILGSSFGETEPFPTNKHWSGIMSMFSDYRIQNLSAGGSNVVSNLYNIRNGNWNVQGKYVVITNNENISTLDITKYVNGLDNLCTTLIGMGKIPIVCTNYHKSQLMSMAIEKYAYEHNLMFWDCSKYCSSLTSGIYGGFDDGAHLRRRNAPMVAYAYLNHLLKMGKPFTSIKVFDIRDNTFSGSLDDLVFSNNTERAKLFKEIKISSTSSLDEYNKLISNTAVSFDKYGLIEITIPSVSKYVEYLKLNLNTNGTGVKVYVKNTNVSPYPNTSAASTIRFSVSDTINVPSLGDVYSYGGVNYTVQSVVMGENNYYCTIYCSPSTMPSSQTGTLSVVSQVSGSTGSNSISFVMAEEATLDLNSFIVADNKGHWVELTGTNNSFEVPSNLYVGSIQIDKLSFLIEATSSSFQLKDVNLDYSVSELKDVEPNKEFVWYENDFLHTNELLPETTFGTVGTTTQYWKDGNGDGIVSIADYEQKYPAGATSMIKVSDTLSMNILVSSSVLNKLGDVYLEIYCRYFPSAPTPYSQANDTNVNNNSFDFNTLFIKCGSNSTFSGANTAILTEEIGLYWKIVRIPICWFINSMSEVNNLYLSLYSNSNGIEVCKVSLKYKD